MPEEVAKQDPNAVSQTSPNAKVNVDVHQKLNGTESQRTPKLLELFDTQVFSGSVCSWVLLVISSRVSIVSGDGGPMFKSSGGHGFHTSGWSQLPGTSRVSRIEWIILRISHVSVSACFRSL